jgi:hypothetical protein
MAADRIQKPLHLRAKRTSHDLNREDGEGDRCGAAAYSGPPGEAGLTMNLSVDAARRIAIACLQALKDPDEGTGEAFGIALWENADYDGPRASDERAAINAFLDHIIKGGSE